MLDLFCVNVRDALSSSASPSLGKSDHTLVLLNSNYTPHAQQQPVIKKTFRRWCQKVQETLKGCFEATDKVLSDSHGDNINAMTKCVIIPTFLWRSSPQGRWASSNKKPWITSDLKRTTEHEEVGLVGGRQVVIEECTKTFEEQKIRKNKEVYGTNSWRQTSGKKHERCAVRDEKYHRL